MSDGGQHKEIIMFCYVSIDNMQFRSMPPNIMAPMMDFPFLYFPVCECKCKAVSRMLQEYQARVGCESNLQTSCFPLSRIKGKSTSSVGNVKRAPGVED